MRPAAPPPDSAAPLLAALRRCRLLRPERIEAPAGVGESPDAILARLIESGELTRFQAEKLSRGCWQGLAVGPYRVQVPVGRGGMGVVYLGLDSRSGSPVALKVLPPQKARHEPRVLARFEREAELSRALPRHPHLAGGLDDGEEGGVRYLALEFAPGETARQAVRRRGPLSVPEVCRLFADAVAGLRVAHAAGVVHRDVKPSNIMATPGGRGVLLDFGLALRPGEPAPADPALFGGPGYAVGSFDTMPPEQTRNALDVGPAADAYSLGCSLFHLLTGGVPFPADSVREKVKAHRRTPPPALRERRPEVPEVVARLVRELMAKSPADRPDLAVVAAVLERHAAPAGPLPEATPASAAEWLRAAEERWLAARATGDEPVAEPPADAPPPGTDWVQVAVAAVVTLLLLGGLALGAWIGSR